MRAGSVVAIVMLLLAGCTSEEGGGADEPEDDSDDVDLLAAPPVWDQGDWWRFDLGGLQVTWVVSNETDTHYILDVDESGFRFFHDAFVQTSTIGPVSKDHLSGSQEAGEVKFFDFPLTLNKTWEMTWDGVAFQATVVDVFESTAQIRAEASDGSYRVYTYDASKRWFSGVAAYHANGTEEFTGELVAQGKAFSGTVYRWIIHDVVELAYGVGQVQMETFQVPEESTDIWYDIDIVCSPGGIEGDQGTWSLHIQPEDGEGGWGQNGVCPAPVQESGTWETEPGEWGVTVASTGARINVTVVPRTLQEIRF